MAIGFSGFAFRVCKHVSIHSFKSISGLYPFTLSHCGPSPPCVRFAHAVAVADATLSTWRLAKASRMGTFTPQTKPSFARRTAKEISDKYEKLIADCPYNHETRDLELFKVQHHKEFSINIVESLLRKYKILLSDFWLYLLPILVFPAIVLRLYSNCQ